MALASEWLAVQTNMRARLGVQVTTRWEHFQRTLITCPSHQAMTREALTAGDSKFSVSGKVMVSVFLSVFFFKGVNSVFSQVVTC